MFAFTVRRLLWAIPVLFFVSLVTFYLMHQAPGGPFDKDNNKKQVDGATLKALNSKFGLDKPQYFNPAGVSALWSQGERNPITLGRTYLDSQFFNYVFNATHGDLGPSYRQRGKSVQDILLERWPYSLRLGIFALLFAVIVGIPLGIIAALRQNTIVDYVSLFFATIGVSIPTFISGLLVIIIFGTALRWISISTNDWDTWRPYIAPGLVLGLATMSFITRITRATMLEIKRQDYIRTARAKGLAPLRVTLRHALRNALIPAITIVGLQFGNLLAGTVVIETVFSRQGLGRLAYTAILAKDFPIVQGVVLLLVLVYVLLNVAVDLSYGLLDPRIRYQ